MARPRHVGVHLSDEEMRGLMGAERAAFPSPIPTQVISNGEYNPLPQTKRQRQVEGLIREYADTYGRKQASAGANFCVLLRVWLRRSLPLTRCSVRSGL